MSHRPIRVCIISVHSYPAINPRAPGLIGGMETISWGFAREMARLPDTEVSFVVTHRMAPRRSCIDGVTIIEATEQIEWYRQDISVALKDWRKSRKVPWGKLVGLLGKLLAWGITRPIRSAGHLRWQTPSKILMEINADIYVAYGVNQQAEWAKISAKSLRRPFVLCLMSDADIDQRFRDDPQFVNPYGVTSALATRLISQTDGVVSQTLHQQRLLRDIWRQDSIIVSNPLDLIAWDQDMLQPPPAETPEKPFVLWVGRADRFHKRPLEMLRVINANPQFRFLMVLNPADDDVLDEVKHAAGPNLTILPQVSPRQMATLMSAAAVFASTGSVAYEGLPAVLLQAAASATPIVSLEASAEWLEASGAGICARGDRDLFAETVARFVRERESPEVQKYGLAGRSFVAREHNASQQSMTMLKYLRQIVDAPASRESRAL